MVQKSLERKKEIMIVRIIRIFHVSSHKNNLSVIDKFGFPFIITQNITIPDFIISHQLPYFMI